MGCSTLDELQVLKRECRPVSRLNIHLGQTLDSVQDDFFFFFLSFCACGSLIGAIFMYGKFNIVGQLKPVS